MIQIEITVEELLDLIKKLKDPIKKLLETYLQTQVDFFCGKENPHKIHMREWTFNIIDIKDENNKPIENAFAKFTETKDIIEITEEFYTNIFYFMKGFEYQFEHAMWMTNVALLFCASHEMSHLYAGHCQLCNGNKLGIFHDTETGLSYLEHQAIELEADHVAAGRVAEMVATDMNKEIFRYKDEEQFYSDAVRAICIFFYYLRFIGKENNADMRYSTHPPTFFRCFWSFIGFIAHYNLHFEDRTDIFLNSFFKNLTDMETYGDVFLENNVLDLNSINEYRDIVQEVWDLKLKDRIRTLRRLPFVEDYLYSHKMTLGEYKKIWNTK